MGYCGFFRMESKIGTKRDRREEMRGFEKMFHAVLVASLIAVFTHVSANASNWYVDKNASGPNNGTSWDNAWTSIGGIVWTSVQPGDTVYISGGTTSKTYNERLTSGKSGTAGNFITISVGQDGGHNGTVILDGTGVQYNGITLNNSYFKITGQVGSGTDKKIKVQNAYYNGVSITGAITNFEVCYLEITQNNRNLGASAGVMIDPKENNSLYGSFHHNDIHNQRYGDDLWVVMSYTGTVNGFDKLIIYNNNIYDSHAVWVKLMGEGISFYNNTIRDRGTYTGGHPDGIQAWSGYSKIYNNKFYGFHRSDDDNVNSYIRFNPDGVGGNNSNPQYIYIYNNLFYENLPLTYASGGNVRRGIELSLTDPSAIGVKHLYFMNNTIVGTTYFGLFLGFHRGLTGGTEVDDIIIANNLFLNDADASRGAFVWSMDKGDGSITYGSWGSGANVIFDYNSVYAEAGYKIILYFNGTGYATHALFTAASGTNSHGVTSNPSLNSSLYPNASSGAVNSGVSLSPYFTTDYAGTTRPQGSAWDIGAYERESTLKIPQPPSHIEIK